MPNEPQPANGDTTPSGRRCCDVSSGVVIWVWALYEWATALFPQAVLVLFMPLLLGKLTQAAAAPGTNVTLMNIPIAATSFFSYCVAASVLIQLVVFLGIGGLADTGRNRRWIFVTFSVLAAFCLVSFVFVTDGDWRLGGALLVCGNVLYGSSHVVYNSWLPLITGGVEGTRRWSVGSNRRRQAEVSTRAFALGFAGTFVALGVGIVALWKEGADSVDTVRWVVMACGLWWLVFATPAYVLLPTMQRPSVRGGAMAWTVGYRRAGKTVCRIRQMRHTGTFLVAFFIYSDGYLTIALGFAQFATHVLSLPASVVGIALVAGQVAAMAGAYCFHVLARWAGSKRLVLLVNLLLLTAVPVYALLGLHSTAEYMVVAMVYGINLGSVTSISRALFAEMIPAGHEAEFMAFYSFTASGTSWVGPLVFGLVNQLAGSLRWAMFSLVVFFVLGMALLLLVDPTKAREEGERVADHERLLLEEEGSSAESADAAG